MLPIAELREMLGIEAHNRFDYFELKQGRKITDIRFVIASNTEPEAVRPNCRARRS